MKRVSIFIALLLSVLVSIAQTQPGYVKTLGRPEKKGEPLKGVSIRVKGEHNSVLSRDDGNFSLLLTGKKNGDAYSLQQVVKSGYELNELGMIGRPYAFSDKIPLTIVMVSTAQLQAEKIKIENSAYQVAENNYKLRLASLEKQREEKSITIEEYRKEILDLQNKFEKYQSLISGLAEHYAHTDYDVLNETEREINLCIENGALERADSLIHTLFNPVDVLERNSKSLARIDQNIRQANEIISQANEDMAAVLKQQAKDAEYLYQLYTISLARFDNEKAARYIETRAQLDSTNVKWQLDAGNFLRYLSYNSKAREYYEYALHNAINQSGVQHYSVAKCYNYIGMIYHNQGNHTKSMEFYNKSLNIWKQLGILNQEVVANYVNIGSLYEDQGHNTKALSCFQKALDLQLAISDKDEYRIATIKLNMAISYNSKALYVDAYKYFKDALVSFRAIFGEQHLNVASCYSGIGNLCLSLGNYSLAMESFNSALKIHRFFYGENHPHVAVSYNNLGVVYSCQGNHTEALKQYKQALDIYKCFSGENHPDVATSYDNLGGVYANLSNYTQAIEYYEKALVIRKRMLGDEHPDVAISYNNLGKLYDVKGNYTEALKYYTKALDIRLLFFGENNLDVATSYNHIGTINEIQGNYSQALKYHEKALNIRTNILGNHHIDVAISYNNIGIVYKCQKKFFKALEYYEKALVIQLNLLGETSIHVSTSYNNIGMTYLALGDYSKALENTKKALNIRKLICKEPNQIIANSYSNIGEVYAAMGEYNKSLLFYEEALKIRKSIFQESHPDVATSYANIGGVYNLLADYGKTLEYENKALDILIPIYGEHHIAIAKIYFQIAYAYVKQNDYVKALPYMQKQLDLYREIYGYNDEETIICSISLNSVYTALLLMNPTKELKDDYHKFISEYVYTFTVVREDSYASKQGITETYFLFEYGNWNINSYIDIISIKKLLEDDPVEVVLLNNDEIKTYHLDNTKGCNIGLKYVGKEEKRHIVNAYQEWKNKQNH